MEVTDETLGDPHHEPRPTGRQMGHKGMSRPLQALSCTLFGHDDDRGFLRTECRHCGQIAPRWAQPQIWLLVAEAEAALEKFGRAIRELVSDIAIRLGTAYRAAPLAYFPAPDWYDCDWGYCSKPAVAFRPDPEGGRNLPVCREHLHAL